MNKSAIFKVEDKKVGKVGKKLDFPYFITFYSVIFLSQCMAIQPYSV
jgi:hypothetical protein